MKDTVRIKWNLHFKTDQRSGVARKQGTSQPWMIKIKFHPVVYWYGDVRSVMGWISERLKEDGDIVFKDLDIADTLRTPSKE